MHDEVATSRPPSPQRAASTDDSKLDSSLIAMEHAQRSTVAGAGKAAAGAERWHLAPRTWRVSAPSQSGDGMADARAANWLLPLASLCWRPPWRAAPQPRGRLNPSRPPTDVLRRRSPPIAIRSAATPIVAQICCRQPLHGTGTLLAKRSPRPADGDAPRNADALAAGRSARRPVLLPMARLPRPTSGAPPGLRPTAAPPPPAAQQPPGSPKVARWLASLAGWRAPELGPRSGGRSSGAWRPLGNLLERRSGAALEPRAPHPRPRGHDALSFGP